MTTATNTIPAPQDIFGSRATSLSVKWMERWLEEWTRMNLDYVQYMDGNDALYWHNKRANLASLASAAWRVDYHAVEDYSAMRRREPASKKRSGCVDLYVAHGTVGSVIEAKMSVVSPRATDALLAAIMDEALEDVANMRSGEQGIGAVFYVLTARKEDVTEAMILEQIDRIRATKPSAIAWCFPARTRYLKSERPGQKKLVWPGVILALKSAARSM